MLMIDLCDIFYSGSGRGVYGGCEKFDEAADGVARKRSVI